MTTAVSVSFNQRTTKGIRVPSLAAVMWRLLYVAAFRLAKLWWFLRRPRHAGALIAIWWQDQLLVVRQSYRPTVCLPGGGVGRRETPQMAAAREVSEELGLVLSPQDLSLVRCVDGISEFRRSHVEIFEAKLRSMPCISVDGREIVEAFFIDVRAALRMQVDPLLAEYLHGISASAA